MKLRWVMRQHKGKPMFILQQLEDTAWIDVPVVDDGRSNEDHVPQEWVTEAIKEAWRAHKAKHEARIKAKKAKAATNVDA